MGFLKIFICRGTMNRTELSIIIVSYNVRELLIRCIESVIKNIGTDILIEIIVVDNCSVDGSSQAVRQRFSEVKIIENNFNAGFPAANNQGFAVATGDYILMLNPDTEIIDNSIQKLLAFYKTIDGAGIVGPKLLNPDMSRQNVVWRFPKVRYIIAEIWYLNFLIPRKYYKEKDFNTSFEVDSMSGAALIFSKKVLQKLGGLDEKLFWIEDVDLCFRAHEIGLHNYYYHEAAIIHHIGQSAKKNYNLSIYFQTVNKINFYKVHGFLIAVILLWVISFVNVILKLFVFLVLSPFRQLYFYKTKAYFYTLKRFLTFK